MPDPIPAGLGQQLVTTQMLFARPRRATKKRTKTRAKKAAPKRRRAAPKRRAKTRAKKPARLVKGSAAAKRHMAKLRKMRKR